MDFYHLRRPFKTTEGWKKIGIFSFFSPSVWVCWAAALCPSNLMAGSNFWVFTGSSPWNIPRKQMETSLLQHPQSWGRFLHEELTACCKYCTYSMDKWWTWAFSRFFFFNFATFAGLELIPFKTTTPKTFLFPAVMFPFLYPERKNKKKPLWCVPNLGQSQFFFSGALFTCPGDKKISFFRWRSREWAHGVTCLPVGSCQRHKMLHI